MKKSEMPVWLCHHNVTGGYHAQKYKAFYESETTTILKKDDKNLKSIGQR
ncbi:hypothetical protein JWG39_02055 [Desulforhopalus vacuolatus]|nr:hypothetical protein [Desulforhopalus vacuolatus]MBM9518599.1 hypothetical protein [Desulforhopalus vacuolatus]